MSNCSPTLPIVTKGPFAVEKTVAQCGKWITLCGKGKHYVSYFLGTIQAPVAIWYERATTDDELYVVQDGEIIANAAQGLAGSFTFDYAPLSKKTGDDEIILVFEGSKNSSRISFRLDCPEDRCLPEVADIPPSKETSIACGKHHHQAGYVKKNTIILGEDPGYVDVIWSVKGSGQIVMYQGKSVLKILTSNRSDTFTFYYDPDNGPVYALTQGVATVDYIFTCPFIPEVVEEPVYEFTCGPDPYTFTAPRLVEVKFPVVVGVVDFKVTVEKTVAVTFMQNNVPFYVLSNHEGTVEFSYDYDPDDGKVKIQAEGYGNISVIAKCPVPEVVPTPEDVVGPCGTTMVMYPGYSNVTLNMNNISGPVIFDFTLTGTSIKIINGTNTQNIERSGSYNFTYDKAHPLVVEGRGNDFQMRVSCPVRQPITTTLNCGETMTFDSYSVTTIRYGSGLGNSTITASLDVSVYRDGVLVGMGKEVTFFYTTGNVIQVRCLEVDKQLTLSSTCPTAKILECGPDYEDFVGGDVVDVAFLQPLIRGHVKVGIQITGDVSATFRLGNVNIRTVTQNTTFEQIMRTSEGLRIISSGTGTFKLKVECAVEIYVVGEETKTERVPCKEGETSTGTPEGNNYVTATWTVTTYSDGSVVNGTKSYDGVCTPVAEVPIRPARWGVAMFANRTFTGGPIASEITEEEALYGVNATTSPSGKPYTKWTGIQDFCDKIMTHTFTPTSIDTTGQIQTVINVDEFVYIMWDKRAASEVTLIDLTNNFEITFDGVLWRNDLLGNYEGLPEYNANLSKYLTVKYDDGTGLRDWVIIRQEATTLPEYAPRSDKYAVTYKVENP